MKETYLFIKDYKEKEVYRKSLSELAKRTFGIQLEAWYQSGYWKEKHIPYSIVEKANAYVIAEVEKNTLYLYNVFASEILDLDSVINAFGKEINQVILEFTPIDKSNYEKKMIQKEDSTLFVMGEDFAEFKSEEKMFPTLSHA
jgi:hypothetical protein